MEIGTLTVNCFDSPVRHAFDFTPSFSFFFECASQREIRERAEALFDRSTFLMPLGSYGFSRLFAWVTDRFGRSWQLNLV